MEFKAGNEFWYNFGLIGLSMATGKEIVDGKIEVSREEYVEALKRVFSDPMFAKKMRGFIGSFGNSGDDGYALNDSSYRKRVKEGSDARTIGVSVYREKRLVKDIDLTEEVSLTAFLDKEMVTSDDVKNDAKKLVLFLRLIEMFEVLERGLDLKALFNNSNYLLGFRTSTNANSLSEEIIPKVTYDYLIMNFFAYIYAPRVAFKSRVEKEVMARYRLNNNMVTLINLENIDRTFDYLSREYHTLFRDKAVSLTELLQSIADYTEEENIDRMVKIALIASDNRNLRYVEIDVPGELFRLYDRLRSDYETPTQVIEYLIRKYIAGEKWANPLPYAYGKKIPKVLRPEISAVILSKVASEENRIDDEDEYADNLYKVLKRIYELDTRKARTFKTAILESLKGMSPDEAVEFLKSLSAIKQAGFSSYRDVYLYHSAIAGKPLKDYFKEYVSAGKVLTAYDRVKKHENTKDWNKLVKSIMGRGRKTAIRIEPYLRGLGNADWEVLRQLILIDRGGSE